jgi:hypothetical protein
MTLLEVKLIFIIKFHSIICLAYGQFNENLKNTQFIEKSFLYSKIANARNFFLRLYKKINNLESFSRC